MTVSCEYRRSVSSWRTPATLMAHRVRTRIRVSPANANVIAPAAI